MLVCVFVHSCFIENPSIDLEATNLSFLRWFCHSIVEQRDTFRFCMTLILVIETKKPTNTSRFFTSANLYTEQGKHSTITTAAKIIFVKLSLALRQTDEQDLCKRYQNPPVHTNSKN
jgi:hypothetical protein